MCDGFLRDDLCPSTVCVLYSALRLAFLCGPNLPDRNPTPYYIIRLNTETSNGLPIGTRFILLCPVGNRGLRYGTPWRIFVGRGQDLNAGFCDQ